jgi:hypothetical protein
MELVISLTHCLCLLNLSIKNDFLYFPSTLKQEVYFGSGNFKFVMYTNKT